MYLAEYEVMKFHRKSPCDCCGSYIVTTDRFLWANPRGKVEESYNERCYECGNLLYGYSKVCERGLEEIST